MEVEDNFAPKSFGTSALSTRMSRHIVDVHQVTARRSSVRPARIAPGEQMNARILQHVGELSPAAAAQGKTGDLHSMESFALGFCIVSLDRSTSTQAPARPGPPRLCAVLDLTDIRKQNRDHTRADRRLSAPAEAFAPGIISIRSFILANLNLAPPMSGLQITVIRLVRLTDRHPVRFRLRATSAHRNGSY